MEKAAIKAADENLARATPARQAMENAQKLSEIETAWSDFLTAANRIFSKLEQGAKVSGKSNSWYGRKKHERSTSPLLSYIHHARNADEYGIARVTEKTGAGLALGVGPGAWRFDGTFGPGGTMKVTALGGQVPGESKFVEVIPSKVRLVAVIDRGVKYEPPIGPNSAELTPIEVANTALVQLKSLIEDAEQL